MRGGATIRKPSKNPKSIKKNRFLGFGGGGAGEQNQRPGSSSLFLKERVMPRGSAAAGRKTRASVCAYWFTRYSGVGVEVGWGGQ